MAFERKSKGSFALSKCIAKSPIELLATATVDATCFCYHEQCNISRANPIFVASPKVVNVTTATVVVVCDFTDSFSVHNSIEDTI
jgi:hypothetical protein